MDKGEEKKSLEEEIVFEEEEFSDVEALKKLRERLKICVSEKQEYLKGWQRAKADFINYKKDDAKRLKFSLDSTKEKIIKDLLPILDSFHLAEKSKDWNEGMENILNQLESLLKENQIEKITDFDSFNPAIHESVEMITSGDKKEDGKIEKIIQDGYRMGDKVIRPAKVQVKIYQDN